MQAFLLGNLSNGGVLELMMRFLKSMGHRFLLRWPPGLAEVVLSTYHSWRRHSASLPNPLLRDCSNRHIQVGLRGALAPLPRRRTAASRGSAGGVQGSQTWRSPGSQVLRAVWVRGPWAGSLSWDTPGTASWQRLPGSAPPGQGGAVAVPSFGPWTDCLVTSQLCPLGWAGTSLLLSLSFLVRGGATHPPRALSGLKACAWRVAGLPLAWDGPQDQRRAGLTGVPESVPGRSVCLSLDAGSNRWLGLMEWIAGRGQSGVPIRVESS